MACSGNVLQPKCSDFGFTDCCPDCHLGLGPPFYKDGKRYSQFTKDGFVIISDICCRHYHEIQKLGPEAWHKFKPKSKEELRKEREIDSAYAALKALGIDI